jgi:hypothetical protein
MRRHLAWTITSSDSSQQRAQTFEAGGGRIIARCPFRVIRVDFGMSAACPVTG